MSVIYALVAKDKNLVLAEFNDSTDNLIGRHTKDKLKKITDDEGEFEAPNGEKIFFKKDVIIFGCACTSDIRSEKAYRFLSDLKNEFEIFYKGDLTVIFRQTNLNANILDKPFRNKFQLLFENYNTGISTQVLKKAFEKVDETKSSLQVTISHMEENTESTQKLLEDSEEMKILGMEFERESKDFGKRIQKRNWWLCSKPCLVIFGGGAILIVIVILLIYFLI